jgi:hypothetical protein
MLDHAGAIAAWQVSICNQMSPERTAPPFPCGSTRQTRESTLVFPLLQKSNQMFRTNFVRKHSALRRFLKVPQDSRVP